jgi:hypothetical protein
VRRRLVWALCGLFSLGGQARSGAAAEIIDRVLAVVSGDLIMLSDLNAAKDFHLVTVVEGSDPVRAILPQLIDRALILAEVDRYAPPEPSQEALERQVRTVRAEFPTEQAFELALTRVGFDDKRLRERLRQDLRILAYLDQRFTVQAPSDDDLGRYYREHPQTFVEDGRVVPFEGARSRIVEAATAERRQALISEWLAGLRRRAEIIEPTTESPEVFPVR